MVEPPHKVRADVVEADGVTRAALATDFEIDGRFDEPGRHNVPATSS